MIRTQQEFSYKAMQLVDTPSQNILQHFHETSAFIRDALDAGGILFVHCLEGRLFACHCLFD